MRSAGGGSGPVSLNQLNSLRDEDLLAEDLVGMKKVQLVKVRTMAVALLHWLTLHLFVGFLVDV